MKRYIDIQGLNESIGFIGMDDEGNPIELIQAGTTITLINHFKEEIQGEKD